MKIPAVVNYAPQKGAVELREIERPEPGPEDVLLEVRNVGVCGSDLHQWTAQHSWPVNYPVVLGHEFGGFLPIKGCCSSSTDCPLTGPLSSLSQ